MAFSPQGVRQSDSVGTSESSWMWVWVIPLPFNYSFLWRHPVFNNTVEVQKHMHVYFRNVLRQSRRLFKIYWNYSVKKVIQINNCIDYATVCTCLCYLKSAIVQVMMHKRWRWWIGGWADGWMDGQMDGWIQRGELKHNNGIRNFWWFYTYNTVLFSRPSK